VTASPELKPGFIVELSWYPPAGERYGPDAYAGVPGTVTSLRWYEPDGTGYQAYPAKVLSVTVRGDGSQAVARLQVLEPCGEAELSDNDCSYPAPQ
jgi:phage-related protein